MTTDIYADTAESYVRKLATRMMAPTADECLPCYVRRMVTAHGCDSSFRWVERWQRATPSSTRRLRSQLRSRGAFCDCEAIFNVFDLGIARNVAELPQCDHKPPR